MMALMPRFALLLPLLLVLPPAVTAQTAAPQTADADAPSESHIAAALDLLKANDAVGNIQAMLDVLTPIESRRIKREQPNLDDATVTLIMQKMRDAIVSRQDEMLRIYAIEYARHFTEQELRDLAGFYRSDLGQKYITSVPTLMKETAPVITQWMVGVAAQVQQDILKSLPKPPDRKT
jgi:hypothetical protein